MAASSSRGDWIACATLEYALAACCMGDQLLFIRDQLLDGLQRLVEVAGKHAVVDFGDEGQRARRCGKEVLHQRKIELVVGGEVAREVHELDGEIDLLGRAVRGRRRQD